MSFSFRKPSPRPLAVSMRLVNRPALALVVGIVVAAVWMGPGEFAGDVVVPTIERLHHLLAR